jgi:hypothetical protein
VNRPFEKLSALVALTYRHACEQFDALVNRANCPDVKLAFGARLHNLGPEHQVLDVLMWDHDALLARQPARLADPEKSFDLVLRPADGLYLAALIHRSGHSDALLDGQA